MRRKQSQSYDTKIAITPAEFQGLQQGYDHFNQVLFGNALPDVFITYQRKANSQGYFSPDRFAGRVGDAISHELALNPDAFIGQTEQQICQTLVHEMAHLWQHVHGKPASRGYHNKEWAARMKAIGLQPSSTGMVGGKETGQRMLDYPIPDGPFAKAYKQLAQAGWKLNWQSAARDGQKPGTNNSKTKFSCPNPDCGQNAWGKPDLDITCTPCGVRMRAVIQSYETLTIAAPVADLLASVPSYEPENAAPKRKRGRPKGSKNKPKIDQPKRRPGRPKGSKNIQSYDHDAA